MVKMPDINELIKYIKMLNDLELVEHKIITEGEFMPLFKAFTRGLMRVEDKNLQDRLPKDMIDFQIDTFEYITQNKEGEIKTMATESNATESFDRDDLEEKLAKMDFDDLEEYVVDNKLGMDIDEDDFTDKQDDWIEQILDKMEEKAGGSKSSSNGLEAELKAMDFSTLKKYIKADALLKEKIGLLTKDNYADEKKRSEIIGQIIKLKGGDTASDEDSKETVGIRQKLYLMDHRGIKAFVREHNLDLMVKSKEWKDNAKRQEIAYKIADLIEGTSSEKPLSEEETKKLLEGMGFSEILDFAKDKGLSEDDFDPEDFDEEDFSVEKPEMIKCILKALSETFQADSKKPSSEASQKPKVFNERKTGGTYQELAAIVVKEAKKPLKKEDIVSGVMERKMALDGKANDKSAKNFTAVAMQVAIALDVVEFDSVKETYLYKK